MQKSQRILYLSKMRENIFLNREFWILPDESNRMMTTFQMTDVIDINKPSDFWNLMAYNMIYPCNIREQPCCNHYSKLIVYAYAFFCLSIGSRKVDWFFESVVGCDFRKLIVIYKKNKWKTFLLYYYDNNNVLIFYKFFSISNIHVILLCVLWAFVSHNLYRLITHQ